MERIEQLEEAVTTVLNEENEENKMLSLADKLAYGNWGAKGCVAELLDAYPDGLLKLDNVGLRGVGLYVLWSRVCDKNIERLIDILKSDVDLMNWTKQIKDQYGDG